MAKRGENIYKRKDGRWEARAIKGYNEQGKVVYAYFYGKTYREAKVKMFKMLPYVDYGTTVLPKKSDDNISFGALLNRWLDASKIRLKESSSVKYQNIIKKHINPFLGKHPLSGITNTILNKFFSDLLGIGRSEPKGISKKTAKDVLSVIKTAMSYAKKESLVSGFNLNVVLPKEKPKDMRVLSTDEQATLEKFLCDKMDESKLGIFLSLYTGLRVGEICALVWQDIYLEDRVLTVRRTMQRVQTFEAYPSARTKVTITSPKSNFSVRTIPLPGCLVSKLQQFHPSGDCKDVYLLTGESERYVEPRTLQNRFKTYLLKCGLKKTNLHALRHTFATRCIALGFDIKSLSEILGHSNVNITLNRYVHPSFEMKRSNMDKLEALH